MMNEVWQQQVLTKQSNSMWTKEYVANNGVRLPFKYQHQKAIIELMWSQFVQEGKLSNKTRISVVSLFVADRWPHPPPLKSDLTTSIYFLRLKLEQLEQAF